MGLYKGSIAEGSTPLYFVIILIID